mgnify:CR=1 FL=1
MPVMGEAVQALVDAGLVTEEQVDEATRVAEARASTPLQALLDAGVVAREQVVRTAAEAAGLRYVDLTEYTVNASAAAAVPADFARRAGVLPLTWEDGELLVAVGIRALTRDEAKLAKGSEEISVFYADDIHEGDAWLDQVVERLTGNVYISFDVDCFDPSLVPSTGTPEPGGLTWYPVLKLLRRVFDAANVRAVDLVELAPIPGLHAPDFLVAKLIYKMIGYKFG